MTAWRNPILMNELYHERGLTTDEMADKLGCAERTIRTWLKKLDIETRPRGRRPGWETTLPPMWQLENDDGYEVVECFDPIRDEDGEVVDTVRRVAQIHRLVAIAEWGYDQVMRDDVQVHHRDGMKLHNAAHNLVPMERKRHADIDDSTRRWQCPWVGDYEQGEDGPPGTEDQLEQVRKRAPTDPD